MAPSPASPGSWARHALPPGVVAPGPEGADAVTGVLAEAFRDYPVMRHVLGPGGDYAARLRNLVRFFVRNREVRDELLLGVPGDGGLLAAALVSRPGTPAPDEAVAMREAVWAELGAESRRRYEAFGAATTPFEDATPHLHLNMIGVLDRARGLGLGRRLIEAVHALSAADDHSTGVSLTTELEQNLPFYARFGYRVVGTARVDDAFTTWGMYRADP